MKAMKIILTVLMTAAAVFCLTGCVTNVGNVYPNGDKYTAGDFETGSEIKNLEIDWVSGSVSVSEYDGSTVTVTETCNKELNDTQKVHTWLDGSTLHIRFCKSGTNFNVLNAEKKLTVKLPKGTALDALSYDATSADASFTDIKAKDFSTDTTSGNVELIACEAENLDFDATSGDLTVDQRGESDSLKVSSTSGSVSVTAEKIREMKFSATSGALSVTAAETEVFESDATSSKTTLQFGKMPGKTTIDRTSGDVTLLIAKDAGFTADIDMVSGTLKSDLPLTKNGDTYTYGSGESKISIDTSSGNVIIKEAE